MCTAVPPTRPLVCAVQRFLSWNLLLTIPVLRARHSNRVCGTLHSICYRLTAGYHSFYVGSRMSIRVCLLVCQAFVEKKFKLIQDISCETGVLNVHLISFPLSFIYVFTHSFILESQDLCIGPNITLSRQTTLLWTNMFWLQSYLLYSLWRYALYATQFPTDTVLSESIFLYRKKERSDLVLSLTSANCGESMLWTVSHLFL